MPPEDPDRFIYDLWEIKLINSKGSGRDEMPYIRRFRGPRQRFGIRCNRNMTPGICLKSIVTVGHNEFVSIWLQILITLYFWIHFFLALGHVWLYGTYKTNQAYYIVLVMNLVFALSATITLVYLIFYSISAKSRKLLE